VEPTRHRVRLAATPFGPKLPGLDSAHHTSLAVDSWEFSFSGRGIVQCRPFESHTPFSGKMQVVELGFTAVPIDHMVQTLSPHFAPGTYDMLRKNCNSFTDCCIAFLLRLRLDEHFSSLERIGHQVDAQTHLIDLLMGAAYDANPHADDFSKEHVARKMMQLSPAQIPEFRPPSRPREHREERRGRSVDVARGVGKKEVKREASRGEVKREVSRGDEKKRYHLERCRYGAKCYNREAKHRARFVHPGDPSWEE